MTLFSHNAIFRIAVFIVIAAVVLGAAAYYHQKMTGEKSIKTETFSCPGLKGFSFEYPLFSGFDRPSTMEDNIDNPARGVRQCTVFFPRYPVKALPTDALQLTVSREAIDNLPYFSTRNPNGVPYLEAFSGDGYWFRVQSDIVSLTLKNISADRSFDKNIFWQTVIDSFKIIESPAI